MVDVLLCALRLADSSSASAVVEPTPAAPADVELAPAQPRRRLVVSATASIAGIIYVGDSGTSPSTWLTPDETTTIAQTISIGYAWPRITLGASAVFMETVYSAAGRTGFAFGGVTAAITLRLEHGFSLGLGPTLWYRAFNANRVEVGASFALARAFPISQRTALTVSVSSPQIYTDRFAAAVGAGVGLAARM